MPRNYETGFRDMAAAGRVIVARKHHGGFQTHYDIGQRWGFFSQWAAEWHGVKKMEQVSFELVVLYGQQLQAEFDAGLRVSSSAPKNYVSAVNTVMRLATKGQWKAVRPGSDCGISPRQYIASVDRSMPASKHETAKTIVDERIAVLLELQRAFGLRFKESCLLNAKMALKQALATGSIKLTAGTKGGKKRSVPCRPQAINSLMRAAEIQDGRSMIPQSLLYVDFRRACYEQSKKAGIGFHSERHHYAQERYTEITSAPAPIHVGWGRKERIQKLAHYLAVDRATAKTIDSAARLQIAIELGHNREEISYAYLG